VEGTAKDPRSGQLNPSGYIETQGDFALRCARELGPRLGVDARVELLEQTDFSEPLMRINTQPIDAADSPGANPALGTKLLTFIGDEYVDSR